MYPKSISTTVFTALLPLVIFIGCSGSGTNSAITSPELIDCETVNQLQQGDTQNYNLWGFWWAYVDPTENIWEFVPTRAPAMHFNIREILEDGLPCTDCLSITGITEQPDGTADVYIRLSHPIPDTTYTCFDLKGIAMWNGSEYWPASNLRTQDPESTDGLVTNADGYTTLFNPTDFPQGSDINLLTYNQGTFATPMFPNSTLNPYIDYYSNENRHMFEASQAAIRTWNIRYPTDQPFVLGYAVCASWEVSNPWPPIVVPDDFPISANQPEPYFVSVTQTELLAPFTLSVADVEIQVWDWQNDPGGVWIECPDVWDGFRYDISQFFDGESTTYTVPIDNDNLVDEGLYRALIGAVDSTSGGPPWDFTTYQFLDLEVKDLTPYVNYPPVAAAEAEQYSVYTGDVVQFHSLSTDPNGPGDITQYLWDFENDETWEVDETDPTWVYDIAGTYFVDHRVIDTYLEMDDLEPDELLEISVTNPCCENPPVAVINGALANIITQQVLNLVSASYDPDNNPPAVQCPVTVEWDTDGDGVYDGITSDTLDISWDVPGIYTVGLKATDACGLEDTNTIQVSVHVGVTLPEDQEYKVLGARYGYASEDYTAPAAAALGVDVNNPNGPWDFTGLSLTDIGNHTAILDPNHPECAAFKDLFTNYDFFYKSYVQSVGTWNALYLAERWVTAPDRYQVNGVHQANEDIPTTDLVPPAPWDIPFPIWIFTNTSISFVWNLIFDVNASLIGYGEGLVTTTYPGIVNEPSVVTKFEVTIDLFGSPIMGGIIYGWYIDDGTLIAMVIAYNSSYNTGYDYNTGLITGTASFNALETVGSY